MDLLYKKLFEVVVRHDYYLKELSGTTSVWSEDYNIHDDLDFIPTMECKKRLKDYQMVLKPCPCGFNLYARALKTENLDEFSSFIYIPSDLKLTFLIRRKNPFFSNFTNLRLTEEGKQLYYFNNLTGHKVGSIPFLTLEMLLYNPLIPYQYGDLILRDGTIREATQSTYPPGSYNTDRWVTHEMEDARYVTHMDQIPWQRPDFTYKSTDDLPGEIIKFELVDVIGNPVPLRNIPNTDLPQDTFIIPIDTTHPLHHTINFDHVPEGKYTLRIIKTASTTESDFFLLNLLLYSNIFGIIEIFAHVPKPGLRFLKHRSIGINRESIINEKAYQIRFKNRLTTWKYLFPDESEVIVNSPRGLRKTPTEYQHVGIEGILPDPDINLIDPIRNEDNNKLIENIYSEIFLNEQYK